MVAHVTLRLRCTGSIEMFRNLLEDRQHLLNHRVWRFCRRGPVSCVMAVHTIDAKGSRVHAHRQGTVGFRRKVRRMCRLNPLPKRSWQSGGTHLPSMTRPTCDGIDILQWTRVERADHVMHALREIVRRLGAVGPLVGNMAMRALNTECGRPKSHSCLHIVLRVGGHAGYDNGECNRTDPAHGARHETLDRRIQTITHWSGSPKRSERL